ncbi:hypothetical protein vseg_012090 [Gypsophila vaccaria]
MEYNIIRCFIVSLLSLSLLASTINGRKILEEMHGRQLKEQFMSELIRELLTQDEDLYKSKIEAIKTLTSNKDESFVGHLNPWANYWIYDNANKKSTNNINEVKNKDADLNESKLEMLKSLLEKEDKSFVGHLNPWANYWIYDNANKKSSKDINEVRNEDEVLSQSKLEAPTKLLENEDKSFVGHLNPWANYWIYDNANKKSFKNINNVNNKDKDLNQSKLETLKKEDKSFVGHLNPWANYWIYDNANKKSSKDDNNVKSEDKDLNKSKFVEDGNANKNSSKGEKEVVEQSKATIGSIKSA